MHITMQLTFASLFLAGLAAAAPSLQYRQATGTTQLTFTGAGASFNMTAKTNGKSFNISMS